MIRILFAGSPDAARLTLEHLVNAQNEYGFEIAGVLSNPPSAKGRHKELIPTPVAQFASEKNIPVFTPEHLDAAAREAISPNWCRPSGELCLRPYFWSQISGSIPAWRNKSSSFPFTKIQRLHSSSCCYFES